MRGQKGNRWLSAAIGIYISAVSSPAYVSYVNETGQPQKWNLTNPSSFVHANVVNRDTRAVRYYLAADAFSQANKTAELNAARACFDEWQAIPGTILRFEEAGQMSGSLDVNTADNTNLVYWTKTTTIVNGGLDNIRGATGVTFFDVFSDGTRAEADIVLNGKDYLWMTDFNNAASQAQFIESVLLHEIGHFIGLAHSPAIASTMFPRGAGGVDVQAGLSADEIAAAHGLYPAAGLPGTLGGLIGAITKNGSAVAGAIVSAEDNQGNLVAATVTRVNGRYDLPALPPGQYQVRAMPLDPLNVNWTLFRAPDVAVDFPAADVNFLPTGNKAASVNAGASTTVDFAVSAGTPAFRIGRLGAPRPEPFPIEVLNYPVAVPFGSTDVTVGVYTIETLSTSARLRVSGLGLTFGETSFRSDVIPGLNPPLNLIAVPIHIASDAVPGMRTLMVEDGESVAYANGALELSPPFPDYNFDGLDDHFQHQYFARWTAPEAGPDQDPDHDGFNNAAEYIAGSNPGDPQSVLKVESVRLDASGATIAWPSAPGRRYQVLSRPRLDALRGWQPVGSPVLATGDKTEFLDKSATTIYQFYRVQAVP
ncbi:MAG: carboxypeptidase regulatory-like domain-containing protein [Verrucomicrobiota bacterium]